MMARLRRRRRKLPRLASLKKEADRVLSLWIRHETSSEYNGKCPLCPDPATANPVECCFHFVRRKRLSVRWDERNLVGACNRCNWIEYRNPDPSRAWFIRKRGVEKYLSVVDQSQVSGKQPSIEYLEEVIKAYAVPGRYPETLPVFR